MNLLAPDILEIARDLHLYVHLLVFGTGLFLWLLGAWGHRFWLVLVTTLAAGMCGLVYGPELGMQRLVAGLLFAVAAGGLALALVRVVVFAAVGLVAVIVARLVAPGWEEPVLGFVVGGLVGLLFYKLWVTILASAVGTLLMAYAGVCLGDKMGLIQAVPWSQQQAPILNWGCGALVVLGTLLQFVVERVQVRRKKAKAEKAKKKAEERARRPPPPPPPPPWWKLGIFRQAG